MRANVSLLGNRRLAAPRRSRADRDVHLSIHPTKRGGDSRLNAVVGSALIHSLELGPGDPVDLRFTKDFKRAVLLKAKKGTPATKLYMRGHKGRVAIRLATKKPLSVKSAAAAIKYTTKAGVVMQVPSNLRAALSRL